MKAVVVLSGGQDSATCLALAVKEYGADEVAAITFEYGQRHALETKYAKKLVRHFKVKTHNVVKLDFYKQLTTNALMDKKRKIEKRAGEKCPSTVVEGRNAIFLMSAAVWAKSLGAHILYTGVSEADYSGYPDCREEFIKAQEKAICLALDYEIRIVTPFMHMSKMDEWAIADKLGIMSLIEKNTLTCYNGIPGEGCGECPSCKLRNRGLNSYKVLKEMTALMEGGDVMLIPTDTVYGLAAHPDHPEAIEKIYALKGRDEKKKIALLCADAEVAAKYIGKAAAKIGEKYWPGALTIVAKGEGVRVPDSKLLRELLRRFGGALRVTSANFSGQPPATTTVEAAKLGIEWKIASYPIWDDLPGTASSVWEVKGGKVKVLREGPVKLER